MSDELPEGHEIAACRKCGTSLDFVQEAQRRMVFNHAASVYATLGEQLEALGPAWAARGKTDETFGLLLGLTNLNAVLDTAGALSLLTTEEYHDITTAIEEAANAVYAGNPAEFVVSLKSVGERLQRASDGRYGKDEEPKEKDGDGQ